jgi:methyl-accepting chemotaxis protein
VTQLFGPHTSYRLKVLLPPVLLLLLLLGTLSSLGNNWLREATRRLAQAHADASAAELVTSMQLSEALKTPGDKGIVPVLNQVLDNDAQLLFALVRVREQLFVGVRSGQEGVQIRDNLYDRDRYSSLTQGSVQSLGGEFVISRRQLQPSLTGGEPGELMIAAPLYRHGADLRSGLLSMLVMIGVVLVAYIVVSIYLLSNMGRRMERLAEVAQRIEGGDLKARIGELMPEELSGVGRAFDMAADRLSQAVTHIGGAAQTVERTANDVGDAKTTLQRGISTQVRDVDEALQSTRDIMQALAGVIKQAESTRDEMRHISNVTQRLANTVQENTATVEEAERVVTLTNESNQQAASITADIAKHADTLSDTTASTANAMLEMKHSISRVRETAITAASLAEQAGVDAERGTQVLTESMTGIEHIREASRAIGAVTEDLERRVGEIGDVLHLITELTRRTNLLALNASIIAAQAGAEGRGFAVVADEIKDLARRTAISAGSIDTLIQAVAEGAHAARRAAVAGADAVETGVAQSSEAARTMTDILSRLRNSAAMAKSIAAATEEQARSSAYVTRSIQEVQGHVNEISTKAVEQTRRSEYLQRQVARSRELIEVLSKTSREHREGMVQVADTVARVVRALEDMSNSQRSRLAEGERVRGMLEVLRRVVTGHREQISAFDRAISDLQIQAMNLRNELARMS